jgi:hypothetical protein
VRGRTLFSVLLVSEHPTLRANKADSCKERVLKSLSLATSDLDESFHAIAVAQENVDRCFNLASVQGQPRSRHVCCCVSSHPWDFANVDNAANLERHEELKSILADFQAPLNRWSEQLTKITDDLDGELRLPASSRSADGSQQRREPRSCTGYLPSHTSNTTNKRRKVCSREPANGFSRTPSF